MVSAWLGPSLEWYKAGSASTHHKNCSVAGSGFRGQFSQAVVPSNSAHHDGALKLAQFLLSDAMQAAVVKDLGGFPARWSSIICRQICSPNLPMSFRKLSRCFPADDWESSMNDSWYIGMWLPSRSTARKNDAVRQRSDTPRSRQWVGARAGDPPGAARFCTDRFCPRLTRRFRPPIEQRTRQRSLARQLRPLLSDQEAIDNPVFTLWVTAVTTFLLLAFCLPLSIYLRFASGWVATVIQGLAIFPLFVPAIVVCYALIRFMGPHGVIASLLAHLGFPNYSSPYLTGSGDQLLACSGKVCR